MAETWSNWRPRPTPKDEDITPESFNASLWHLAKDPTKQPVSEKDSRPPSAQEYNFQSAPESIRKAWIDSEYDPLYPSQSLKRETSFSFGRMYDQNERTDAINASAQQNTVLPVHGTAVKSPHGIVPNGTAPIGSELKEMKHRQITYPQIIGGGVGDLSGFVSSDGELDIECSLERAGLLLQTDKTNVQKSSCAKLGTKTTPEKAPIPAEHGSGVKEAGRNNQASKEGDSDKSFRTLCGLSFQEFNEQKAADASHKNESDNSGGAPLTEEQNKIKERPSDKAHANIHSRKSSSTSSTVTIKPTLRPTSFRCMSISSMTSSMIADDGISPPKPYHKPRITFGSHESSDSQDAAFTFRHGASENDEFFNPPLSAREQSKPVQAKSSDAMALTPYNSVESGLNTGLSSEQAVAPLAMNTLALGAMPYRQEALAQPHVMFRRDLSSEDLAALQAQSFQAGQTQIMHAYERDIDAMVARHENEMYEKDLQLTNYKKNLNKVKLELKELQKKYDTDVCSVRDELDALGQKMNFFGEQAKVMQESFYEQKQKFEMSNVTPTNQVVFQEPATHAHPLREPAAPLSTFTTPENQMILVQQPAYTFPGAVHPAQHAGRGKNRYGSPEYAIQQRLSTNSLSVAKPFEDKEWQIDVNVKDDVFDDPTKRPGLGLHFFFQTIGFEQKGLHEALSSCFGKVEHAVRLSPLVKMTGHVLSDEVRNIVTLCQEHIEHRAEVYSILANNDEKYLLVSGVLNSLITDKVFREGTITAFECVYQAQMIRTWEEEKTCREVDIANTTKRSWLGKQRAEVANLVVQIHGFWKWVKDYTHTVVEQIMPLIQAAFPKNYHAVLRNNLWAPVNDAIRLAIRIRQDPRYFEYHFQRVGCTWDNRYMVARNPELAGQELSNVRTPYVTRCTARPLIKVKNFDGFDGTDSTIHKSEVLLSERKNTLRPFGRPGQYAQRGARRHR